MKRGEIDFHSERNYMDIPLDIHCSEGNQIYAGIKCNVPSQIFSDCGDIFSLHEKKLNNLTCNFSRQDFYFILLHGLNRENNHVASQARSADVMLKVCVVVD